MERRRQHDTPHSKLALVRETLFPSLSRGERRLIVIAWGSGVVSVAAATVIALVASPESVTETVVVATPSLTPASGAPSPSETLEGPAVPPVPGGEFRFVIEAQGTPYIVLANIDDEDAQNFDTAGFTVGQDDGVTSVIGDTAAPPEHVNEWMGRAVTVNSTCDATIDNIRVAAQVIDHFGTAEQGSAEQRQETWDLGARYYLGQLSGCASGYARVAEQTPILPFAEIDISKSTKPRAVLRRVRHNLLDSSVVRDANRELTANGDTPYSINTPWTEQLFYRPGQHRGYVVVATTTEGPCGDLTALVGVYAVHLDSSGNVIDLDNTAAFAPFILGNLRYQFEGLTRAYDITGDGIPELEDSAFATTTVVDAHGEELHAISTTVNGCGC